MPAEKPASRGQREREANAYRDSLTLGQEGWVLRKMGFFKMGLAQRQQTLHRS